MGGDFGEGALDVVAATLLAVDEAEDSRRPPSFFASGFDGRDGGGAGGVNIVDEDAVGAPGVTKPSMRRPVP